jgi:hypothetical protein
MYRKVFHSQRGVLSIKTHTLTKSVDWPFNAYIQCSPSLLSLISRLQTCAWPFCLLARSFRAVINLAPSDPTGASVLPIGSECVASMYLYGPVDPLRTSSLFLSMVHRKLLLVLLAASLNGLVHSAGFAEGDYCGVDGAKFLDYNFTGNFNVAGDGCTLGNKTNCLCSIDYNDESSLSPFIWQCGAVEFGPKGNKTCPATVPVVKPTGVNSIDFSESMLGVPVDCDTALNPTGYPGDEACGYSECESGGDYSAICGCVDGSRPDVGFSTTQWICLHSTCNCPGAVDPTMDSTKNDTTSNSTGPIDQSSGTQEYDYCGVDGSKFLDYNFTGNFNVAGVGCTLGNKTNCLCSIDYNDQSSLSPFIWQCGTVEFGPKGNKTCPAIVPVVKPTGVNSIDFSESMLGVPVECDTDSNPTGYPGDEPCGYSECESGGDYSAICGCVDGSQRPDVEFNTTQWICLHSACNCPGAVEPTMDSTKNDTATIDQSSGTQEYDYCGVDGRKFLDYNFTGNFNVAGVGCTLGNRTNCLCSIDYNDQSSLSPFTWQCGTVEFGPKGDKICPEKVPVVKTMGVDSIDFTESMLGVVVECNTTLHPTGFPGDEVCGYSECESGGNYSAICGCVDESLVPNATTKEGMQWICLYSACNCPGAIEPTVVSNKNDTSTNSTGPTDQSPGTQEYDLCGVDGERVTEFNYTVEYKVAGSGCTLGNKTNCLCSIDYSDQSSSLPPFKWQCGTVEFGPKGNKTCPKTVPVVKQIGVDSPDFTENMLAVVAECNTTVHPTGYPGDESCGYSECESGGSYTALCGCVDFSQHEYNITDGMQWVCLYSACNCPGDKKGNATDGGAKVNTTKDSTSAAATATLGISLAASALALFLEAF